MNSDIDPHGSASTKDTDQGSSNSGGRKRSAEEDANDTAEADDDGEHLDEQDAKLQARREANRMHALKSRQRSKQLLSELQVSLQQLSAEKGELERQNAVLRAQVEVLQQQNRALLQSQQQLVATPAPSAAGGGGGAAPAQGTIAYNAGGAPAAGMTVLNPNASFVAGFPFASAAGGVPSLMHTLGLMAQLPQQQQPAVEGQVPPTFGFAMAPTPQQQAQSLQPQPSSETAGGAAAASSDAAAAASNSSSGGYGMTANGTDINSMIAAAAAAVTQGGSVPGLSELFRAQQQAAATTGGAGFGNGGAVQAQGPTGVAPYGPAAAFSFLPTQLVAQLQQQQQAGSIPSFQQGTSTLLSGASNENTLRGDDRYNGGMAESQQQQDGRSDRKEGDEDDAKAGYTNAAMV
jgi:hypothetical protein